MRYFLALLAGGVILSVQAQTAEDLRQLAQSWVREAISTQGKDSEHSLRLEANVGALDNRLKLAPCGNVEPYLPAGARLWGATRVGLRCIDGVSRWNVTLPVTVNAFGNAWVIKDQIPLGAVLTESSVLRVDVNWAQESSPVLADKSLWLGQVATRALSTGQTLRQGMVKPAQVFQAGTPVRVVAQGSGFEISSEAQALSGGVVGQLARVRMENGRVTSGVVLDLHTVKIDL
jgi:flagella basal body P-ring formation protein FlgA